MQWFVFLPCTESFLIIQISCEVFAICLSFRIFINPITSPSMSKIDRQNRFFCMSGTSSVKTNYLNTQTNAYATRPNNEEEK